MGDTQLFLVFSRNIDTEQRRKPKDTGEFGDARVNLRRYEVKAIFAALPSASFTMTVKSSIVAVSNAIVRRLVATTEVDLQAGMAKLRSLRNEITLNYITKVLITFRENKYNVI